MRFIHAADLHLDTAFVARSDDVRERLRKASREALRRLVELALTEGVDAVILAGDLFDGDRISFQTERLLSTEMKRLDDAHIPVIYATGNHDPGATRSRASTLDWPPNVQVAGGTDPVRIEIRDREGVAVGSITAVGHSHAGIEKDLVPNFPPPTGEGAHVAVLHATVVGSPQAASHARYAPTDIGSMCATGYHYWALGHIHIREALLQAPGIHYPGNTQGRNLRERGPKGCLLVDLSEPAAPHVAFHRLGSIQWEDLLLDKLEVCGSVEALLRAVRAAWAPVVAQHTADPPSDWIVRVKLSGATPLARTLSEEDAVRELSLELRDVLGVLEVEVDARRAHEPVSVDDHVERKDVLGEALRLVRSVREGGSGTLEVPELVGPSNEIDMEAYLAELLEVAEFEVLARMLKTESERA